MQTMNLMDECKQLARKILSGNGANSDDVVETLASRYLTVAQRHQDYVRTQLESDDVIAYAVRYIADVHAMPPYGTETEWFRQTLDTLMELAVPISGMSEQAGWMLECLQEGIRKSKAEMPVTRASMRVDDEDAEVIKKLQEAGCEHGVVSDLLDLVERLQHCDPMDDESRRLWRIASIAAPITRTERRARGIDK